MSTNSEKYLFVSQTIRLFLQYPGFVVSTKLKNIQFIITYEKDSSFQFYKNNDRYFIFYLT